MPPHVFAISDNAYYYMRRDKANQCCVISGESGAGKTETTKLLLQFLAAVSGQHSWIEQQILEANPILEAFGNAKTLRNDNSSRFGKYIDVQFDMMGAIKGALVEQYLLEQSRIVHQLPGERNYHIFYFMCKGADAALKASLKLGECKDYYLCGTTIDLDKMDDVEEWEIMNASMKVLQFEDSMIQSIYEACAAVLYMGNIKWNETETDGQEASEIVDDAPVQAAAELLKIPFDSLKKGLITRSMVTRGETTIKALSPDKAKDARDSFAKGIYGRFFIDIVQKVSDILYVQPQIT